MKVLVPFFVILIVVSCSKKQDSVPGFNNGMDTLPSFTVTVVDRAPNMAIITWTAAPTFYNSDTVKYDIVLNGKQVRKNLLNNIDTLTKLSPDSLYTGRVFAHSISGDTASAAFVLEKIGGYIVFGDNDGSIQCINLYSGSRIWQTAPTASSYYFHGMPTIVDSTIYINSNTQGIFAINAKTGAKIWNNDFNQPGTAGSSMNPLYKAGKIYTIANGKLYSLNSTNGQTIWSFSDSNNSFQSNPVISNNLLFEFAVPQRKIVAININTGTKSWEYVTNCNNISKNPVVYNGLLIFGGSDGNIYALNQITGMLTWFRNFSVNYNNYGSDFVSPKIYKNLVIVHNGNSGFYGLNASTGTTVWNHGGASPLVSSPAIGNDMIYYSSGSGWGNSHATALDAATGSTVWDHTFGSDTDWPTPIFAKNRLYFGNNLTWGWGIPVLNASNGTPVATIASNIYQVGPEAIVAGDSTFYASQSGMVQ